MKKSDSKYSLMLLLTAAIWGFAFVAQSTGGDAVGPFTFNFIRNLIGAVILIPVILILDRAGYGIKPVTKADKKQLYLFGSLIGIVLFLATNLQQMGITYGRSAGKAGFITACYLILVPVIGIFLPIRLPRTFSMKVDFENQRSGKRLRCR